MSFREWAKQKSKQTKSDLKAFLKSKDGSDKGTSRPNTPSSIPPHTASLVGEGRVGNSGPSVPGTPPPTQAPTGPSAVPPPGDVADADNQLGQPPEPTSLVVEHHPSMRQPSPSALEITSQVVGTNRVASTEQVAPQPQALGRAATDIPSSHAGSNITASIGQSASGQKPQEPSEEASGGKGLKMLATEFVGSTVDALKFGPFQDISDMFQSFANTYMMEGTVKEHEALQHRLQALLKALDKHSELDNLPVVMSNITEIREFVEGQLNSIGNQQSGKDGRFRMANEEEERFLACCSRVQEYMDQLMLDTSLSTSASVSGIKDEQKKNHLSTSLRIGNVEEEQLKNRLSISKIKEKQSRDRMFSWISRLPSSPSAWYDSYAGAELGRRECTPGTRADVLAMLLGWGSNNSRDAVYWLNGMAGTGKTTIAYSVCNELARKGNPAASFFCSRLREECRNVKLIIPSIAYQLAKFYPSFRAPLSTIIEKDQDAHHKVLNQQFEALIREPLLAVPAAGPVVPGRMVVVIDALDECENTDSTRAILNLLLDKAADLPIKFIVSSRPEPQIREEMTKERVKSRLVLHELDTGDVQTDIKTYIEDELKSMKPPPEKAQIAALVDRAGILFIYAATAVRYISYGNFRNAASRLRTLLAESRTEGTKKHKEIDQLYLTILKAALDDKGLEENERDDMKRVLHTVICAREPLTVGGLSELLQIKDLGRVRAALQPLWSVLHVVGENELVTTLHASFPDFMFDSARSQAHHCNSDVHNQKLADHCFELIKRTQPQFNICGLESSYLPDDSLPNIEERVAKAIPPELLYACRFWADHVDAGRHTPELVEQLRGFLSSRLLLWMEVLSLNKQMKAGMECMKMMVKWCDQFEEDLELVELAHDAKRFVEAFASNPVSWSTPHIYISMLTFWPRSVPIAKHYAKYTHGPVQAEGTALDQRQLAHLATWGFENSIDVMAVSPDGLSIALAIASDVLVVDLSSGGTVLGPLKGHEIIIKSIAFSPDGTRIFAGSTHVAEAIILGWDTRTGDRVPGPLKLKGHTRTVKSLSFSPDCSRIATGSLDGTVRLWGAENGDMLHCLETQEQVFAAVFSPDGTRIAAQFEYTLQVWDCQTGITTLGPLTDLDLFAIIAFSPDQSHIICASTFWNTIHVRNAQTGEKILGPIRGCTSWITCIGCSPDGRYIVSGSHDQTVCLWDAQNGNLVLGPLKAHTGEITSVALTPDGSHIISGCSQGLVCTWDAQQHNLTSSSTNPPFDQITCVKFSSDGTCFVSGSETGTICIWDTLTGEMTVSPIKAHTRQFNAVDFSNDCIALGSEDGQICAYNALTGEVVLSPLKASSTGIGSIAYSPNGKLIAAGSSDQVGIWDAQTGRKVHGPLMGLDDQVVSLQFSPDGTHIVVGCWGWSKNIVVWDVSDGRNVFGTLNGHDGSVYSVSYSPNGTLIASGSSDKTIIIWDASTGKKALGPLTGHSNSVQSVHFSPDSTRLVSGSNDRTIRIWDVQTGEMVFELLNGHEGRVTSVEYSPDGTRILSRSNDMSVRIHDARSPEERALLHSESEVGDWTMNKDGWVVDNQGRLLVWVPGDLRKAFSSRSTLQAMIAPQGHVRLKFNKSRMGESWAQGFTSDS